MFIGPLIGGQMYTTLNGPKTADYIAISNIVIGAICFFFNCGPFVFQEHRDFNKKLTILKEKAEKLQQEEEAADDDGDTSINKDRDPLMANSFMNMP